ncbi:TonB-dependent receptor [Arenimonas fontis]|uniref:TonB-dependent receptor n=1 Tax=Arenimonas fontis TaxID=2608255 RepID=A0A5B2Z7H8_9GAMM|nr:TonB-dependent receptor [Arenimonas fontis]KAA2283919.1 TonB-dependent receptor [Arenimonas fontis]
MTNRNRVRLSKLSLGLAFALAAAPAFAQQTSAALGGVVTSEQGQPIAGAEVIIVHTPSGTTSRATTDASGRYSARGLRVGGPYTVTVIRDGFQSEVQENVYLVLGESSSVNVDLAAAQATELEAITVTGELGSTVFSPTKFGTGTDLTSDQLEGFPSIRRDLQDYVRLDPRISQTDKERGEISAGGQNTRYNSITIDGVTTNDTFGLESNNLPTERQPISIDTIEAVQVNVANYDVTQTRYTGANINAVTKSGTNEFSGSLYYIYRDSDMVGDDPDGNEFNGFIDEETYGGTFGGPLIKDTLFFFLNYEKFTRSSPRPDFCPSDVACSNPISGLTSADVAEAQRIARDVWGFDIGGTSIGDLKNETENVLVKFDWNINENHRASFRYTSVEQNQLITPNLDSDEFSLSSHWYDQVKTFDTYVAQLYSDWSDNLSTEVKLSYREYESAPQTFSRLPQVIIDLGPAEIAGGTEQFRHANLLQTETFNAYFAADWFIGDHQVKFGADYESNDIFNLFLESSLGNYRFTSLADFETGAYDSYLYRTSTTGNVNDAAADFTLDNLGLFVQDTWSVNYNLTLQFGLRLDVPSVDDRPPFNADVLSTFGYDNTATIDGNELIQPRFGFNYTFDTERPTQLRGGFGLFQGSAANVWLANPYTNNGLTIAVYEDRLGVGVFEPDPDNQPTPVSVPPAADVDLIHPDLEQPSVWKANLAFDHELPFWGLVATAELLFTEVEQAIFYEHLNLGAPTGVGPDGRLMYWNAAGYDPANWTQFGSNPSGSGVLNRANRDSAYRDVVLARPTGKGNGQSLTVSLTKPFTNDSNLFWQVGYSFNNATEVSPLTSSRAISNWNGRAIFNPNEEVASRSNYTVRDRFTAAMTYRHFFFDNYKTEFSVFFEGRSGKPFSYTFDNDANGDGIFGNDLLYVPTGPGDVLFGSAAEEAAFFAYLDANPELARYRGRVAERNGERAPWVNTFDVRISQELPGFFEGHKSEIWLDVLNVGNLINDDWGRIEEVGFPLNRGIVEYGGIDPVTGKYVYRFNTPDGTFVRDNAGESRWSVQVGFRYRF